MGKGRMGSQWIESIFASTAVLILLPAAIFAQAPARPGTGPAKAQTAEARPPADLSGVWSHRRDEPGWAWSNDTPVPMQPWAEKVFLYNRDPKDPVAHSRNEVDPYEACQPAGVPRIWVIPRPLEIVQVPGRVLIFYEGDHWRRQIWMDGRAHPKDLDPSWMGHSVGKWDGDTLVVDTVGLKASTWIDSAGHPHSDALHVVERLRRPDRNTLELTITFDDPKAFTKVWTAHRVFQYHPDWEISEVVSCEDRLLNNESYVNR